MKRGVFDKPGPRAQAIKMLAAGVTQAEVARTFGIGQASVSRWKDKAEIARMIQSEAVRLAEAVPDAVAYQRNLVAAGKRESAKALRARGKVDYRLLEAAGRASENVLKTTGILPASTVSQTFNTVLLGTSEGLSPILARLLAASPSAARERDVDPEWEEVMEPDPRG